MLIRKLTILLFILSSINAYLISQTYYIDFENGNNNADGLTQQTAWKHCPGDFEATGVPASTILDPGDVVIFKGGVEYKGGTISANRNGTLTNPIVYLGESSWGTGKAIFNMEETRYRAYLLQGNYLTVQGIVFTRWSYANSASLAPVSTGSNTNGITIKDCNFVFMQDWNQTTTYYESKYTIWVAAGTNNMTIENNEFIGTGRYCIMTRDFDSLFIKGNNFGGYGWRSADSIGWISSAITIAPQGGGNATNLFIQDNVFHDLWQYGGDVRPELGHSPNIILMYGDPGYSSWVRDVIVERNLFYVDRQFNNGTGSGGLSIMGRTRYIRARNNIFINTCAGPTGWMIGLGNNDTKGTADSLYVENNTFISRNFVENTFTNSIIVLYPSVGDNSRIVNNLFYSDNVSNGACNFNGGQWLVYRTTSSAPGNELSMTIDYNSYYHIEPSCWLSFGSYLPNGFDEWKNGTFATSKNYDQNSFWNSAGNSVFTSFPVSPANTSSGDYSLNASGSEFLKSGGVDLSEFFTDDFNGNTRTNWSIGAIEYNNSANNNVILNSKIFLEGPFDNNLMQTTLQQNGLFPVSQPYNTAPWNYNGNENLGQGAGSTMVDWVLVELRNNSNPTQVEARRAAILKNDGTLLETDGSTGVAFSNVQEGAYYIAVFHRNHLAIMSADPVQLSASSQLYDFTTGMNKAYGQNPMVELDQGKYGMYASDGNGNGGITITDRNEIWLLQNGAFGYLEGDFNLDGGVTIHDVNLYWNFNNGTMTQVP